MVTDLSQYNNSWYRPGASIITRGLWYMTNILFFLNPFNPFSGLKCVLLRIFGAKIGKKVTVKPCVNIKYPWKLAVGDYSWIGEKTWIDNLDRVVIGSHCCISQGAMLLCGNHHYKKSSFDLLTRSITLENGVWIGAKSVVGPGVTCRSHAILSVGSVATSDLEPYSVYQGNPAKIVRKRIMEENHKEKQSKQ